MKCRFTLIGVLGAMSGLAYGQTPNGSGSGDSTAPSGGIEEIVVTAQRRGENLQDVPVSVQAIAPAQMQERGVTNLLELQKLSPSLTVQDTASNISPFIRGVGSTTTGAGQFASVATYVDGVYVATLTSGAFDLANVDQIEVLAGPQGALYGRNATGGAIVITTHTPHPDDPLSGKFDARFGNYDTVDLRGSLSGGLGGPFAFSLSASEDKHGGYIQNYNPSGYGTEHKNLNDRDAKSFNLALTFEPTDRLSFILRGAHFEAKDRLGLGLQAVGLNIPVAGPLNGSQAYYAGVLQEFGFPAAAAGAAAAALRFPTKVGTTYDDSRNGFVNGVLSGPALPGSFEYLQTDSGSLKGTYRWDHVELSSLSSYTNAKSNAATEIILADPASYPAPLQGGSLGFSGEFPSHNFQEDLQVSSIDTAIKWVGGAFYFDGTGTADLTGDLPGGVSLLTALNTWTVKSTAVYGQSTIPITDTWSGTVGARYTTESYNITDHFNPADPVAEPGTVNIGANTIDSSATTYTARVQRDTGALLTYLGVSTGFKGGALSPVNPASPGVEPEKITSVEGGIKWDITSMARLNAALFHYKYKNIQISYVNTTTGANILVNGPSAKITGLDLQAEVDPLYWLKFRATGLALDTSYKGDVGSAGTAGELLIKGNRLAGAPKFVMGVGSDVLIPFVSDGLKFTVDMQHSGGYYFDSQNLIGTGGANANGFTTLDASLVYHPPKAFWHVSLWGNNITNEQYYQSGLSASGILRSALAASPRVYGAGFGVEF